MRRPESKLTDERLPSLTGMRFVAALMVFVYHASYEHFFKDQGVGDSFANAFSKSAWIGVSFFFILSGFVLTWSVRPDDTVLRFWRRRIAKIYPNHVATWLLTLGIFAWVGQAIAGAPTLLNLFLLHTWVPRLEYFGSVNPVSWSLACEVLFYLAFPVLLRPIGRIRPERLWFWAGIVMVAIVCVPVAARLLPEHPVMPAGEKAAIPQFWFVYGFPPVRGLEFVLGMILARVVATGRRIPLGLGPATLILVAGYVVAQHVPVLYSLAAATVLPLALLIPAAARSDLRGVRSPLRSRRAVWLGEISYAFYLVHYLVLHCAHLAFGRTTMMGIPVATHLFGTWQAIILIVALLGASVVAAALLYTLVERPVMRRWSTPRKPSPHVTDGVRTVPIQ